MSAFSASPINADLSSRGFGTRKPWLLDLLNRRHPRIAPITLANWDRPDRLGADDRPRALPRAGARMN
jgi:hypothetical protein